MSEQAGETTGQDLLDALAESKRNLDATAMLFEYCRDHETVPRQYIKDLFRFVERPSAPLPSVAALRLAREALSQEIDVAFLAMCDGDGTQRTCVSCHGVLDVLMPGSISERLKGHAPDCLRERALAAIGEVIGEQ